MQKKNVLRAVSLLLTLSFLSLGLGACSSLDKARIAAVKNVALSSVMLNSSINTSGIKGSLAAASMLLQLKSFDLSSSLQYLKQDMYARLPNYVPFRMIPEENLNANEAWLKAVAQVKPAPFTFPVTNYIAYPLSKDVISKYALRAAVPEADAFLQIHASYSLVQRTGIAFVSVVGMDCLCMASVYDAGGNLIFKTQGAGKSKTTLTLVAGAFDAKPVQAMLEESMQNALSAVYSWMDKNI